MRLIMLTVMGLMAGLGLAAAIVSVPVMAEKGPLRATLVAHLGGGQEEDVQGGGDPDGRGRAVVKVFKEQVCARVKTGAIETSSSKVTIHLGMSGEVGPTVANLQERAARTPLADSTTPTTTTTGTTTPTTGTTTSTTGATGTQTGTTTTGDSTSPQATATAQSTTVEQTSLSQSTASPTAGASASASATASAATASAASTSRATINERTSGCVEVPRALSLELLEHPRRFYVNVTNGQSAEGAIRGQLHRSGGDGEHRRSGDGEHRSGDGDHRSGNDDD
jgi:hypothetical protein